MYCACQFVMVATFNITDHMQYCMTGLVKSWNTMGNDEDMYHAAGCGDVHRVRQLLDWGASTLYKAHGVRNEPSLWPVMAVLLCCFCKRMHGIMCIQVDVIMRMLGQEHSLLHVFSSLCW